MTTVTVAFIRSPFFVCLRPLPTVRKIRVAMFPPRLLTSAGTAWVVPGGLTPEWAPTCLFFSLFGLNKATKSSNYQSINESAVLMCCSYSTLCHNSKFKIFLKWNGIAFHILSGIKCFTFFFYINYIFILPRALTHNCSPLRYKSRLYMIWTYPQLHSLQWFLKLWAAHKHIEERNHTLFIFYWKFLIIMYWSKHLSRCCMA